MYELWCVAIDSFVQAVTLASWVEAMSAVCAAIRARAPSPQAGSEGNAVSREHLLGWAAIIVKVHADDCVNLCVFTPHGSGKAYSSVLLRQPGVARPDTAHCEYMPVYS